MTCSRDTYIADWTDYRDAKQAWQGCYCLCCRDALGDDMERLKQTEQTTL